MKSFDNWLDAAGKGDTEEVDDTYLFRCYTCGKEEYMSWSEYEKGDTPWFIDMRYNDPDEPTRVGKCGGSQFCLL